MTAENCGLWSPVGSVFFFFFFFLMTIWGPTFNFTCTNDHPNFNLFKRRRSIFTFTADRGKESVFTHVGSMYANLFEQKMASQLIFLRRASVKLSVMLFHRHRAIIWYAFGIAWLNSRGWGCSKEHALWWTVFAEFLYRGLSLSFKAQFLPQVEEKLCLAGYHVIAQTQGYHLVCIWGSLVKFQGVQLF